MAHSSISDLFHKNLSTSYQVLENARARILKGASDYADESKYTALQSYLQEVFYPTTTGGASNLKKIEQNIINSLDQSFAQEFERYDFASNTAISTESGNGKLGVGMFDRGTHTKGIYSSTLYTRIGQLQAQIATIKDAADCDKLIQDMNNLISLMQSLLSASGSSPEVDSFIRVNGKNGAPSFGALIKEIDILWQQVTYYASLPIPNWAQGQFFEKVLQLSQKGYDYLEKAGAEEISAELSKATSGSQAVGRGALSVSTSISGLQIMEKPSPGGEGFNYTVQGDNGSSYTVSGVFSKKSGKVDVIFNLPETANSSGQSLDFRISAKNWQTMDNRDFGNTTMLAAILRTTGELDAALAYGVQMGWPSTDPSYFGRMCAAVDILMGYSQSTGYADTIVINDRSAQQIKVYSMAAILEKISTNMNDSYFKEEGVYTGSDIDFGSHLNLQFGKILGGLAQHRISILSKSLN